MDHKQFKRLDGATYLVGLVALVAALGWLIWALATGFDGLPPIWFWGLASFAGLMILVAPKVLLLWEQQTRARQARELAEYDEDWIKRLQGLPVD